MNARHAAEIRLGIRYGRASAAIAHMMTHGRYPITRGGSSWLQWRATVHTLHNRLRNWDEWSVEYAADVVTVIAGGYRHPAPAGTEPKPPAASCPTRIMDGRNELRCWFHAGHDGECK